MQDYKDDNDMSRKKTLEKSTAAPSRSLFIAKWLGKGCYCESEGSPVPVDEMCPVCNGAGHIVIEREGNSHRVAFRILPNIEVSRVADAARSQPL